MSEAKVTLRRERKPFDGGMKQKRSAMDFQRCAMLQEMLAKILVKKQASSLERCVMLQEIYRERDATFLEVCIKRM
jgi:hypothetical protein